MPVSRSAIRSARFNQIHGLDRTVAEVKRVWAIVNIRTVVHQKIRLAILERASGVDQMRHLVYFNGVDEGELGITKAVDMFERGLVIGEQALHRRSEKPAAYGELSRFDITKG